MLVDHFWRAAWAARWEHDKDPELFFAALHKLKADGVVFRLNVIGEQFREVPAVFATAKGEFTDEIERWGYQPSREAYVEALHDSDVIVSTARHEFFGLSVLEAIAAGAYPLLPRRLSYPELLDLAADPSRSEYFYEGDASALAVRLRGLGSQLESGSSLQESCKGIRDHVHRFCWPRQAAKLDDAILQIRKWV